MGVVQMVLALVYARAIILKPMQISSSNLTGTSFTSLGPHSTYMDGYGHSNRDQSLLDLWLYGGMYFKKITENNVCIYVEI